MYMDFHKMLINFRKLITVALFLLFYVHLWGDMCICIPNMKFLSLNLWLGEVCTDDASDGQSMIARLFG